MKPSTLQQSYKGGMKRDGAREQMAQGACWNVVDFLPEVLGALLRKRGGFRWGSQDLEVLVAPGHAYSLLCGIVAEFSAGQSILVMDVTGRLYEIESTTSTEIISTGVSGGCRNPVFYNNMAIWPEHTGVNPPAKITRSGTTHTGVALGGSPPAGKYALVYKDVLWLAGSVATPDRIYFSVAGNPESWDLTVKWWDVSYPITGLAALSNAVLVFSLQRTSRFRGSKPPPDPDFTVDDPVFEVGCTDNRSIQNYRDKCIFANAQGLYMTDGVALEDLTRVCGMKAWWRDVMKGRDGFATGTPYSLANWKISGGIYDDFYFYSIIRDDTGQLVDAGMIDLTRYAWTRLSNLNAAFFFDRLYPQELFWCHRLAARTATISDMFAPTDTNEIDATLEALQPYLETGFFVAEPGLKTFQDLFLTYDVAGTGPPSLRVSYALTPEAASYTALVPDLSGVGHCREHLEINQPGQGISFKIQQIGTATDTRLHAIEVAAGPRERSR